MQMPVEHRFTAREYHRMAETGVLKPDARVELLDGQIIDMSPIGPSHGGAVKRLIRLFGKLSAGRWLIAAQDPLALDDHSEPEPDLMLLKPAKDDYSSRHPGPEDVFLLIEVADTSLAYDRGEKLPAYARAGVTETWILNLVEQTLEVCRDPQYDGYGSITILRRGDQARPLAFPDVAVEVAELLGQRA
jgi:Uma2 family endonuclease